MKQPDYSIYDNATILMKTSVIDTLCRNLVYKQLKKIKTGELVVYEALNRLEFGNMKTRESDSVSLHIDHPCTWRHLALGGTTGAGEAYMQGAWRCNDLVSLVRLVLQNKHVLASMDERISRITQPLHRVAHWFSRNSIYGSRKNISAHYDLGNEFFSLFLDSTMMYSSAFYPSKSATLELAATAKLDRICQKLQLSAEDKVIEIGTGWGGFAIHAAKNYGCHVTTTTISKQQYHFAKARIETEGVSDKVNLLLQDYRDLEGVYDKLVSIEMIEAVGHQYLNTYFEKCNQLLKEDGSMCIQAITITDNLYKSAIKEVDFIKKYIFPGGFLPSIAAMSNAVATSTDMKVVNLEDIGLHYARTLSDWRSRFFETLEAVIQQGYPASFIRMWEFYLCYCEGGFRENYISTVQMILIKPRAQAISFNSELQKL
jgi:cyclopropane-fatty-acyl-phospholipid synthase